MTQAISGERRFCVGILGGIGPQATIDLMQRVVDATPAEDDRDHIHMLVDNDPGVPSRIKALIDGTGPSPAPHLAKMARRLAENGVDLIAMPCNTAHHYLDEIRAAAAPMPVLDMIALTAKRLAGTAPKRGMVGVLASTAVQRTGLYDKALADAGLQAIFPKNQNRVMDAIKAIKAGDIGDKPRRLIAGAADELAALGVDALLIACTEISVLADALPGEKPVLDALDVLAEAIIDRAEPGHPAAGTQPAAVSNLNLQSTIM